MKVVTAMGRTLDLNAMLESQGATVAVGNAKMNARGDRLGRGGEVVKRREDIAREYYASNPKAVSVTPVSLKDIDHEAIMTPSEAWEAARAAGAKEPKVAQPKRRMRESED